MTPASFGAALRQVREAARLSTADVAQAIHFAPGEIERMEQGESGPPDLLTLQRLIAVCGLTMFDTTAQDLLAAAFATHTSEAARLAGRAAMAATVATHQARKASGKPCLVSPPPTPSCAGSFGELMRVVRCRADLSQEAVAAGLGVCQTLISAWEQGRRNAPEASQVARLCAVIGLSPEHSDYGALVQRAMAERFGEEWPPIARALQRVLRQPASQRVSARQKKGPAECSRPESKVCA